MLSFAATVTKGGIVLWTSASIPNTNGDDAGTKPKHGSSTMSEAVIIEAVNALLVDAILEGKHAQRTATQANGRRTVHWTFDHPHHLIFIAAYETILQLPYASALLDEIKEHFLHRCVTPIAAKEELKTEAKRRPLWQLILETKSTQQFTPVYEALCEGAATRHQQDRNASSSAATTVSTGGKPRTFRETKKYKETAAASQERMDAAAAGQEKRRFWEGQPVSKQDAAALDRSIPPAGTPENDAAVAQQQLSQFVDADTLDQIRKGTYALPKSSTQNDYKAQDATLTMKWLSALNLTSAKGPLAKADILPILSEMKERLTQRNVAADIADTICQTVEEHLVGQKPSGGWQGIAKTVRDSMEKAIRKILTPQTSTDLLRDIQQAQKERRPFSVVFVGVNGVGKSTNLSKVCFWLLQNQMKVLIAACDTFRSGAVEQLRIHVRNLSQLCAATKTSARVELFEKGYGKDAAGIAADALQHASKNGFDVVLVDTAGRMQDNEPLMRALAKLVSVNQPDRVIFVGEALVGNEAIDQLTKFNRALQTFGGGGGTTASAGKKARQIDGMLLTKFDTVDEKVGAALSMTYITGKPVFFVGTGQTYLDLKQMNVTQIVDTLLAKV